jgi:hypothetical protein
MNITQTTIIDEFKRGLAFFKARSTSLNFAGGKARPLSRDILAKQKDKAAVKKTNAADFQRKAFTGNSLAGPIAFLHPRLFDK